MLLLATPSLNWLASCGLAAAFLTLVWLLTRAALERRRTAVSPATVVLTASLVGCGMSLLALVLLSTST